MKITIFTSNQPRHKSLINQISKLSDKCYAVIETSTLFPGETEDYYKKSEIMKIYFNNVFKAEHKIFGSTSFISDSINLLPCKYEDLNKLTREQLEPALDSDLFIVFGSSYIKGWLIDELIKKNAINIHIGLSPYYRGTSCNFWAAHDNNYELVGATIHKLSKGLDNGDILYHALPNGIDCSNVFEFTMKSVRTAHNSIVKKIADRSIFELDGVVQDPEKEIRYTRNKEFDDKVALEFLNNLPSMEKINHKINLRDNLKYLLEPYID